MERPAVFLKAPFNVISPVAPNIVPPLFQIPAIEPIVVGTINSLTEMDAFESLNVPFTSKRPPGFIVTGDCKSSMLLLEVPLFTVILLKAVEVPVIVC